MVKTFNLREDYVENYWDNSTVKYVVLLLRIQKRCKTQVRVFSNYLAGPCIYIYSRK